jgi:hypothetical protein
MYSVKTWYTYKGPETVGPYALRFTAWLVAIWKGFEDLNSYSTDRALGYEPKDRGAIPLPPATQKEEQCCMQR